MRLGTGFVLSTAVVAFVVTTPTWAADPPTPIQITHSNVQTDTFRPFGLSDDGQRVGWVQSTATDYGEIGPWKLFVGDTAGVDRTELVSLQCVDDRDCSGASLSGDGNTVAFASCDDLVGTNPYRDCEIYAIHSDGTGLRQVTSRPWNDAQQPSLNFDGSVVAFIGNTPHYAYSLLTWFLDASLPVVVDPTGPWLYQRFAPSVDSSGQRVAYQAVDFIPHSLISTLSSRVASTTDTGHRDLTSITGSSYSYALPGICLSRDGTTVLYESSGNFTQQNPNGDSGYAFQAFVMPWDGGSVTQLTDGADVQFADLACNPMVTDGSRAALSLTFTGYQECAMVWVVTGTGVSEDIFPRSADACYYTPPMVSGDGLVLAFGSFLVTADNPYGRGQVLVLHTTPPPVCPVDGVSCGHRNACTQPDVCQGGTCVPGAPLVCDDGNPCTTDSCSLTTGCVFTNNTLLCDDGNACTPNDTCSGGSCHGSGLLYCNDDNPCTDDSCNPAIGCVFTNNSIACDDLNACTSNDACTGGTCRGTPIVCDDGNACTTDSCNASSGCIFTNNTNPCDDGNACTRNDICGPPTATVFLTENFDSVTAPSLPAGWSTSVAGTGAAWATRSSSGDSAPNSAFGVDNDQTADEVLDTPPVAITSAAATLTFRNRWNLDGDPDCFDAGTLEIKIGGGSFADIVAAGGSFVTGGYTGTVSTYYGNPLAGRPGWCSVSTGYPAYLTTTVNLPAAAAGNTIRLRWRLGSDNSGASVGQDIDSIVIMSNELMNTCHGGPAPNCDDGNPCTDDACDPAVGCVHTDNANACSDGNACTGADTCSGGSCHGTAISCDDGNPCTDDTCDPASGCVHTNNRNSCSDGNACTLGDTCVGGVCNSGPAAVCDDGNACNGVETCNPATGCVAGTPLVCDDGNACNGVETCNPATGCVAGTPVVCTALDQCHDAGVCAPATGRCSNPTKVNGVACDDGNPYTYPDSCQGGICVGGASCQVTPQPKSAGYYKSLCKNGQSHPGFGDALTDADAVCVGTVTRTFAGFSTVADICNVIGDPEHHSPPDGDDAYGKECEKSEDELLALALNICRNRVCTNQEVDSDCTPGPQDVRTTVSASLATADGVQTDPNRDKDTCKIGRCLAKEVNDGHGVHHTSLMLSRLPNNGVRMTWAQPTMDDGTGVASSYTIWRRVMNSGDAYTQLGTTNHLTFDDTAVGNWEYEVTFTLLP